VTPFTRHDTIPRRSLAEQPVWTTRAGAASIGPIPATSTSSADRFERWALWILGVLGVLGVCLPLGSLAGEIAYRPLIGDVFAQALTDPQPESLPAWFGTFGTALVCACVGGIGFWLIMRTRPRASRTYAVECLERRRYRALNSPSLPRTVIGVGLGFGPGALVLDLEGESPSEEVGTPVTVVLSSIAVLGSVVLSAWRVRRRVEVEFLLGAGLLVPAVPPGVPAHGFAAFREGVHAWVVAALITGIQLVLGWAQALTDGVALTWGRVGFDLVLNLFAFPALLAILIFGFLFFSPFRWIVRATWSTSSTKISLALLIGGGIGFAITQHWIAALITVAGLVITGVTMLRLMDTGPQPWLGMIFIASAFLLGLFYDPETGDTVGSILPTGPFAWIGAVLAALILVHDVRTHWLAEYGIRHADDPARG
jgi:hypothetical protein